MMELPIKGILFSWNETGTEGPIWAVQDSNFIDKDTGMWNYLGLNILANGDTLVVYYDDHEDCVLFNGKIDLVQVEGKTKPSQNGWDWLEWFHFVDSNWNCFLYKNANN